jgi:hypothetical protein
MLRANYDSAYRIEVETVFQYNVADVEETGEFVADFPAEVWGGHVIPLKLSEDKARFRFSAVRGTVYRFQSDLDVEFVGDDGARVFRTLRVEDAEPWAIHPFRVFLALDSGIVEVDLHRREGKTSDAAFLQLIPELESIPVPQRATYPVQARRPLQVEANLRREWDGGVMGTIGPKDVGWFQFSVKDQTSYLVLAEADDPMAKIKVELFGPRELTSPLMVSKDAGAVVSLRTPAAGSGRYLARVTNLRDGPVRVRSSVLGDIVYDGLKLGDMVRVGRHTPVDGMTNWLEDMDVFVGRNATITDFVGQDDTGSWLVKLDIDQGDWVWRTRNLTLAQRATQRDGQIPGSQE